MCVCVCDAGMVYNVSAYMDFHPGGEEELMKAAGIDGTDLFDQVNNELDINLPNIDVYAIKKCM